MALAVMAVTWCFAGAGGLAGGWGGATAADGNRNRGPRSVKAVESGALAQPAPSAGADSPRHTGASGSWRKRSRQVTGGCWRYRWQSRCGRSGAAKAASAAQVADRLPSATGATATHRRCLADRSGQGGSRAAATRRCQQQAAMPAATGWRRAVTAAVRSGARRQQRQPTPPIRQSPAARVSAGGVPARRAGNRGARRQQQRRRHIRQPLATGGRGGLVAHGGDGGKGATGNPESNPEGGTGGAVRSRRRRWAQAGDQKPERRQPRRQR